MKRITRDSLLTLEAYAKIRDDFRKQLIAHKKPRKVALGNNVTLIFEDELTIRYQIQEMLHAERIFKETEIIHELQTYTPLVPDGCNWKVTMMIEYPDPEERAKKLALLLGIEDRVWIQIGEFESVFAIADEDIERENSDKTSSVHFLRFELMPEMIQALRQNATLRMGIDHPAYSVSVDSIHSDTRTSLLNDFTDA